jgi:tetratricopeptide (TPR) repeat protein
MCRRRTGRFAVALVVALLVNKVGAGQERHVLFDTWLKAAADHVPGQADAPAETVARWSKHQLLDVLKHPRMVTSGAFRRGAVLHLDIALQGNARATGDLFPSYPRTGPGPPPQPFMVVDGAGLGRGFSAAHLEFARALITKLDGETKAAFGVQWYAAVAAQLAARGNFADLWYHLEHAKFAVPESAELLLAAGCLREVFAGPMAQATRRSSTLVAVGDRGVNLRRAEDYFSRALARTPDFVEARLRRGRVFGQQNRHADAVLDLHRAREQTSDREQSYYIRLFLGREEELLGRHDEARRHFEAAAAMFPRAQSPWIALTRLAAYRGDVAGARQALDQGLRSGPAEPNSEDPWWIYDLGPGRYAAAMLKQVYELARREES